MLHAFGPRHVGDMNQSVYARLYLDKRTERRQVANLTIDAGAHRVFHREDHPGILLGLFHSKRDFFFPRIDLQNHCFDRLTNGNNRRWMTHRARPTHLADVHQALDSGFQLDERPVVGDADHLAL